MKKNDGKVTNYKFYVAQLLSDFIYNNFQIAVRWCCNL